MDKERAKRIGQAIRLKRKERGLTMKELGGMIKCSEQAISQYERGERNLNSFTLRLLAVALQCTTDDLASQEDIEQLRDGSPYGIENLLPALSRTIRKSREFEEKAQDLVDNAHEIDNPADVMRFHMYFRMLNDEGRRRALEYTSDLTQIPRYQRKDSDKNTQES